MTRSGSDAGIMSPGDAPVTRQRAEAETLECQDRDMVVTGSRRRSRWNRAAVATGPFEERVKSWFEKQLGAWEHSNTPVLLVFAGRVDINYECFTLRLLVKNNWCMFIWTWILIIT